MATLKKIFHRKRDSVDAHGRQSFEQSEIPPSANQSTKSQPRPDIGSYPHLGNATSAQRDDQYSRDMETESHLPIASQFESSSQNHARYGPQDVTRRLAQLDIAARNDRDTRLHPRVDQLDGQPTSSTIAHSSNSTQDAYNSNQDNNLSSDTSDDTQIPRKPIGSGISPTSPTHHHTSLSTTNTNTTSRTPDVSKISSPVPATAATEQSSFPHYPYGGTAEPNSNYATAQSSPIEKSAVTVDDVILGAGRGNTVDTTVTEKIAPAVVHETIRKQIQDEKQEVITREIHNHDYYHRIQPIIDVEVLPTRHFLPVQGGGLVEVNAKDLPGRVRVERDASGIEGERGNWVIAETVTKGASTFTNPNAAAAGSAIGDAKAAAMAAAGLGKGPSYGVGNGVADGSGTRQKMPGKHFTARECVRQDSNESRWVGEDGVERSVDTLEHGPEREEGGRVTGQTWGLNMD